MSNLIQWPAAKYWTKCWNPIVGCVECSPACANCYAREMLKNRFGQPFKPHPSKSQRPPLSGVVFCGNMTDLFGDWVEEPQRFIKQTAKLYRAPGTPYLYLTKRVMSMLRALFDGAMPGSTGAKVHDLRKCGCGFGSHWFGFTAEDQERYDDRCGDWRFGAPIWARGWLSAEPLLGPIDLGLRYIAPEDRPFEWVVVGCESGPNRRPCDIRWVEWIVQECLSAGVLVFVKQLDIGGRCVTDINQFPAHLRIRQVPWAVVEDER